ncbi:PepSY domain-containing protein [Nocardioides mesophilus]|uniref:PepSY domain-containing protein n=1 Tax=Nocardioides mesophilus TaxID=433659 RepID=A0A7G9R9X4_9ACTN|nr:PepSY domain-containing protein [Nocardioides mesophilus]QNN52399.1 PepSY domain-containing protein [Nocardioides mesophilus]
MRRTRKLVAAGVVGTVVAIGAGGAALASGAADGGDDGDVTVTGSQADRATKAALEITGGGRANSVERDPENGATWEVEVTKPDGDTVDVRLDGRYQLVVVEGDSGS